MLDQIFLGIVNPLSLSWQRLKLRGRGYFDIVPLPSSTGIFVSRIYTDIICRVGLNRWMDEWRFTSLSAIFHSYQDDGRVNIMHEKLCAMERRLGSEIISPPRDSNPRPRNPKSGALTARPHGRFYNRFEFNRKTCLANS